MHDHLHLNLLALDTATEACSVALLTQGQTDAHFELAPREHTQRILPLIDTLLRQRRLTLAELDAIVFCQGPGSFTGVRIGIGIAQGLAFGAKRPLIGVSSLACLAQGAWRFHQANRVLTAIDARMGEIYWAEYQRDAAGHWHGRETEQVITPEQAQNRMEQLTGDWVTAGSGWQACPQLNQGCSLTLQAGEVLLPAAEDMLPLALQCWQQGQTVSPAEVDPVYLRNEVTWKKLTDR